MKTFMVIQAVIGYFVIGMFVAAWMTKDFGEYDDKDGVRVSLMVFWPLIIFGWIAWQVFMKINTLIDKIEKIYNEEDK